MLILNDGVMLEADMKCNGITADQLMAGRRRTQGRPDPADESACQPGLGNVRTCVLEVDGSIGCDPYPDQPNHKEEP